MREKQQQGAIRDYCDLARDVHGMKQPGQKADHSICIPYALPWISKRYWAPCLGN